MGNNFKFCSFYNCFSSNHGTMDQDLLNKLQTAGTVVGLGGEATRPACKKCGYPGHLTFQCRNFLSANPTTGVVLDVSSTSSEEDDDTTTPLTQLRAEELKALQQKLLAREKKLKDKKDKKKKKEKKKSKRRHESSSAESDSQSESSDDSRSEKKHKKRKKSKSKKKKSKDASSSRS